MIQIEDPSKCFGCSACQTICEAGAIRMTPGGMGFLYPEVDIDRCTGCGRCEFICEQIGRLKAAPGSAKAYAVRHNNPEEVARSRSGAAFVAISDKILQMGGVVYGAVMEKDFSVAHRRACSAEERDAMRGSKYAQSSMGDCLGAALKDLKDGRWVLFSGTPCQCRALRALVDLEKVSSEDIDGRLVLVDIVCHGVPSPRVWKEYISHIAAGRKIVRADFRDKGRFGWKAHFESLEFEDESVYTGRSFAELFYRHIILRPSCANCRDNSPERISDLTLADFWGWEKTDPTLNADDLGYSLVLTNSARGERIMASLEADASVRPVRLEDCLQRPLRERVSLDPRSGKLADDLDRKGMGYVLWKYSDRNLRSRLRYARKALRQKIRKIVGRA